MAGAEPQRKPAAGCEVAADGRDVRAAGIAGSPSQKKTKEMKRGESLRGARRCVSGRKQELRNNLCQAPSTKTGFFPVYHENRAGFEAQKAQTDRTRRAVNN